LVKFYGYRFPNYSEVLDDMKDLGYERIQRRSFILLGDIVPEEKKQ
jgi:hypothetical protein